MISSNELIQSKNRYIQLKSELEGVSVSLKESIESLTMAVKGINNSYLINIPPFLVTFSSTCVSYSPFILYIINPTINIHTIIHITSILIIYVINYTYLLRKKL